VISGPDVVVVVDEDGFEAVGGVVDRDADGGGDAPVELVVRLALVVDVVLSAVVGGAVPTATAGGVVVGAVVGAVVPGLAVPCLSLEPVIGRAMSTAPMARTPRTAAAAPKNGARQLASSAVISRPVRPWTAPQRRSTTGVSWVMTPVAKPLLEKAEPSLEASKPSLEEGLSRVGLGEYLSAVPMASAISVAEANGCSARFSMA
jgi:hypothetical protein